MQSRLKSPVVWLTLLALVLSVLKAYGLLAPIGLTEESFREITTLIITVLTAVGILNNPTDKNNF
jgi:phi LC3 family holin